MAAASAIPLSQEHPMKCAAESFPQRRWRHVAREIVEPDAQFGGKRTYESGSIRSYESLALWLV